MKRYDFEVQWHGPEGWECVDTRETRREALQSMRTYRENQPGPYRVKAVARASGKILRDMETAK